MRHHLRFTLGVLALMLAACSPSPPTAAEEVAFAAVCDKANDGQRVATTGYLQLPNSFTGEQSAVLRLYEDDSFSGTPIGVTLHFGSEANQIDMVPDQYRDEDLSVHLANGQVAGYGTRVKVSGKVYFPLVDQDFVCGLDNPLVELAG